MNATRTRLPNRRQQRLYAIEVNGMRFEAGIGFDPETGQPQELFLTGPKLGSAFAHVLDDAATAISVALQHGVPPQALAKSVARLPVGIVRPADLDRSDAMPARQPASVLGAALDLLCVARLDDAMPPEAAAAGNAALARLRAAGRLP